MIDDRGLARSEQEGVETSGYQEAPDGSLKLIHSDGVDGISAWASSSHPNS